MAWNLYYGSAAGTPSGIPGTPLPPETMSVGGVDSGGNLRTLEVGAGVAGLGTQRFVLAADDILTTLMLQTQIERQLDIDLCTAITDWTIVGDASTIAVNANHAPYGDKVESLLWDKAGGTDVISGIQKTIPTVFASEFTGQVFISMMVMLPVLTDVDYVWLRMGTDNANYAEWRMDLSETPAFKAARFERILFEAHRLFANTGTGCDFSDITYVAAGYATNLAGDLLAGAILDSIMLLSLPNVAAALGTNVAPESNANPVNVKKLGANSNADVAVGNGVVSTGVQLMTLAEDSTGQIYPKVKYTDNAYITGAVASTAAPTTVAHGIPLTADTKDISVTVSILTPDGTTVVDAIIWVWDGKNWFQVASATNIQLLTLDRWQRLVPDVQKYGSRIDVQLANVVPGTATIDVDLKESTL